MDAVVNSKFDFFQSLTGNSLQNQISQRSFVIDQELKALHILGCSFDGFSSLNSQYQNSRMLNTQFANSEFRCCTFTGAYFKEVAFNNCMLRDVRFENCVFDNCNFEFNEFPTVENKIEFINSIFIETPSEKFKKLGMLSEDCVAVVAAVEKPAAKVEKSVSPTLPIEKMLPIEKPVAEGSRFSKLEV